MDKYYYNSPIGTIVIEADDEFIRGVNFIDTEVENENTENVLIQQCIKELDEYFSGSRKEFTVPAKNPRGTEFRHKVWDALMTIAYGNTKSYKDIAILVNSPKAVRAVGGANHNNNISIIYPCHRVIGTNGRLTGYGGQLWRKEWLLNHEKKYI